MVTTIETGAATENLGRSTPFPKSAPPASNRGERGVRSPDVKAPSALFGGGGSVWLVSGPVDLAMFLGPAVAAFLLLGLEPWLAPRGLTPLPLWVVAVLLVDVAHVWATIYRTYLDRSALLRRPRLHVGAPALAYAGGVFFYAWSPGVFWTALAYLAVWHFVRQQYGWVALYHRRDAELTRWDRLLDCAVIYLSTIFPLLWWHAHLPRRFDWFVPGDFIQGLVPRLVVRGLWPLYVLAFVVFFGRQVHRRLCSKRWQTGKIVVVATTGACWGVGIISTNSDWAFTVTNVLIHGVPYFVIVWVYGRRNRARYPTGSVVARIFTRNRWLTFYLVLAALAYLEEAAWDRLVWHEHDVLFLGPHFSLDASVLGWVVPLLALPQVTHYILDGYIWRSNPSRRIAGAPASPRE